MRLPLPSKLLLSDIEIIKKQIFYPCPFELPAKQHRPFGQDGLTGRCCLAGNSKGHRRISKIFLSLFLYTWVDQNIFFPEIYNAPIISELGFTVWACLRKSFLDESKRWRWRWQLFRLTSLFMVWFPKKFGYSTFHSLLVKLFAEISKMALFLTYLLREIS